MSDLIISEWVTSGDLVQKGYFANIDYAEIRAYFFGVISVLIGFVIVVLWDRYKARIQEKNSLTTIVQELEVNRIIGCDNRNILLQEQEWIRLGQLNLKPLTKLNHDFSTFLTMNCPSVFKNQIQLLEEVRKISKLTKEINEVIQSRESYKINNGAMSNQVSVITKYDGFLVNMFVELEMLLPKFIKLIKPRESWYQKHKKQSYNLLLKN
jgi:DNA-directed RNA polymerase subunit N (RpoN/RPB10)